MSDPAPAPAAPASGPRRLGGRLLDVVVLGSMGLMAGGVAFTEEGAESQRNLRWAVAALALSCGALWLLFQSTRRTVAEIQEMLADVRFGRGTRRDRDAVEILLRALRMQDPTIRATALRQLRRITGEDLGDDPRAWDAWWVGAKAGFSRGGPPVGIAGGAGGRTP